MPEIFNFSSRAFSQRDARGWQLLRRLQTWVLLLVWGFALPGVTGAQVPDAEPNLGEAAPIVGEDLAQPPGPLGAEVNPAGDPDQPRSAIAEQTPVEPGQTIAEKNYLIPTDPIQLFLAGGLLMWPILLASVISLWFVLERMVVLRRRRVIPRAFVDRFIQHLEQGKLNAETALRLCEENQSPIADVFAHGIRKWGKTSVEVEQAIIDGGERQISQLRTHLRIINGVATVAPLLGLLGTVVGMIMSFNELAQGGDADRAQRLAGGIGVALITTAAGLFVAIPSLILYMFLSGRIDGLVMEMDNLAQKVVNLISSEGLTNRPRTPALAKTPAAATTAPTGAPTTKTKTVGT